MLFRSEYPTIEEQLDALFHAGVFPAEMASRIRAVKTKYPRYSPSHVQTGEQAPVKMSVEEWLAQETRMTADQWLAQQQSAKPMTREEWLASQAEVKTEIKPANTSSTVTRTMTAEEWLREQTAQENQPQLTREQWLAQQTTQDQSVKMTREQIGRAHV